MRRVIVQEFVTVDGFASDANGSEAFIPSSVEGDASFGRNQMELMDSTDTMLLGRVTYEMFAAYWPNATSGDDKEFAARINAMRKVVFSKTLEHAPWGAWPAGEIVKTDAAERVAALKRESGGNLVIWGSISLAQSLADLVDEYQLVVCPVALGSGRSLFRETTGFTFARSRTFDRGAVLLVYEPKR